MYPRPSDLCLYTQRIKSGKRTAIQRGCSGQYSVMTYMGRESKKEWICVHVQLIHFAVRLKLTQHCKPTLLQLKFFKNKEE